MVRSMTAFASQYGQGEWGRAVWEIRSVNHRYMDVTARLPEDLKGMEGTIRDRVGKRVKRGKIECLLRYEGTANLSKGLAINIDFAKQLAAACRQIDQLLEKPAPISSLELLRWPGLLEAEPPDIDVISGPLLELLDSALDVLLENRQREGRKLDAIIRERCTATQEQIARLRARVPEIIHGLKLRLLHNVKEISNGLSEGRLEQEATLLAQKLDVAEEIDRLEAHVHEVIRVLGSSEPIGRRLDFLMQEMNREANTLASKSAHIDTTGASVEIRVLIEQMREQIQNIE